MFYCQIAMIKDLYLMALEGTEPDEEQMEEEDNSQYNNKGDVVLEASMEVLRDSDGCITEDAMNSFGLGGIIGSYDNQGEKCLTRELKPLTKAALEYCVGLLPDTYDVFELNPIE